MKTTNYQFLTMINLKTIIMKTLLLKSKTIILVLTFLTFTFCSSDDDILAPSVTYSTTVFDATFFQKGNSDAPNLDWNGDQGSFSLVTPMSGLKVDSTTGALHWTEELPIGSHAIQVLATNSAGQTSSNVTINNPFQGNFRGTLELNSKDTAILELEFYADNTFIYGINTGTELQTGTGTWEKSATIIEGVFENASEDKFVFSGKLAIDPVPRYKGDLIGGSKSFPFEVVLN